MFLVLLFNVPLHCELWTNKNKQKSQMETKRLKQKMLLLLVLGGCSLSASAQIGLTFNLGSRGDIITDDHYGIFYEEINHAGDGGRYQSRRRTGFLPTDPVNPERQKVQDPEVPQHVCGR